MLALAFRQGLTGYPLQLDLLLGSDPLAALRSEQATRQLLEPSNIDGRACDRVGVDTSDGRFVLWVDREAHVLRRVEYPAATFAAEIAEDPSVDDVQLTADFRGAALTRSGPDRRSPWSARPSPARQASSYRRRTKCRPS